MRPGYALVWRRDGSPGIHWTVPETFSAFSASPPAAAYYQMRVTP
jgi:hypothetical protein